LAGDAPTIDLVVGYNKANKSPTLRLFLSRLDQLISRCQNRTTEAANPAKDSDTQS
jgi:LysR family hca operon transcriptional activator